MPRRILAFLLFAAVIALGCVRLGFWQLARLAERRASNASRAARFAAPPAPLAEVTRDSTVAQYRQVHVEGRYDYEHEFVLVGRTRNGAPGVHVLTPVLLSPGESSAVLVNRGWVYAPDAMRIDRSKWREGDFALVVGYVEAFSAATGPVSTPSVQRAVRRLVHDSIAELLPYPLASFYVVQRRGAEQSSAIDHPFRIEQPALDEGPHKSYAIQWFAFAAIAVIGAAVVARRPTARGGAPPPGT